MIFFQITSMSKENSTPKFVDLIDLNNDNEEENPRKKLKTTNQSSTDNFDLQMNLMKSLGLDSESNIDDEDESNCQFKIDKNTNVINKTVDQVTNAVLKEIGALEEDLVFGKNKSLEVSSEKEESSRCKSPFDKVTYGKNINKNLVSDWVEFI